MRRVTAAEIVALAVPATASAVLQNAYRPLDQLYVSWLGAEAQGALGATTFVLIMGFGVYLLVSAGAGPLVARAVGSGDAEAQRAIVGQAVVASAVISVIFAIIGGFGAEAIAWALGLEGEIARSAAVYLRMLMVTGGALAFGPLIDAVFAARGNTWFPMLLQGGVVAVNAVLTPLFLFGLGMGTEGAALGSTVAQTLGVIIGMVVLVRAVGVRWADLRPGPMLVRMMKVGAPIALGVAMYAAAYWGLLATTISQLGTAVNAALGIGFNGLEAVSWPLYVGCMIAASSIVGRRLGAGEPDEARRAVRMLVVPAAAIGVIVGAVFLIAGPWLVGRLAADQASHDEALVYAFVLAFSQPFVALEALFEGVLAGSGDTRKVFWGSVPFNFARIPLAWVLAFPLGFGAAGVWWAINLTTYAKCAMKGGFVVHGGWSRAEI